MPYMHTRFTGSITPEQENALKTGFGKMCIRDSLKGEEFSSLVSEWAGAVSTEENTASLNKHNPKHLKSLIK